MVKALICCVLNTSINNYIPQRDYTIVIIFLYSRLMYLRSWYDSVYQIGFTILIHRH